MRMTQTGEPTDAALALGKIRKRQSRLRNQTDEHIVHLSDGAITRPRTNIRQIYLAVTSSDPKVIKKLRKPRPRSLWTTQVVCYSGSDGRGPLPVDKFGHFKSAEFVSGSEVGGSEVEGQRLNVTG